MLGDPKKTLMPHQMLKAPSCCRSSAERSCAGCMQVPGAQTGTRVFVWSSQQRN